jgi:centromere/kinetochore protein ZW10
LHKLFATFDTALEDGKYGEAADSVKEMGEALESTQQQVDAPDKKVIKLVKTEYRRKRNRLCCRLEELFGLLLTFDANSLHVTNELGGVTGHTHYHNPATIPAVLSALETVGLLSAKLTSFVSDLRTHVLNSLFSDPSLTAYISRTKQTSTLKCALGGKKSGDDDDGDAVLAPTVMFERLSQVVKYMHDDVFAKDKRVMQALGTLLWTGADGLSIVLLRAMDESLPEKMYIDGALGSYQEVVMRSEQLEKLLFSTGFLSETSSSQGQGQRSSLTAFLHEIDTHFARKTRQRLLVQARELLVGDYHNSVQVTDATERCSLGGTGGSGGRGGAKPQKKKGSLSAEDDDGLFSLPQCRVSVSAKKLVEMAHQTLIEACAAGGTKAGQEGVEESAGSGEGARCAEVLFHTARDILNLFRALVPTVHADALINEPRLSALCHNDCTYLAHHMLMLGHQYRDRLPPPLNRTMVGTVDLVPAFRQLGSRVLLTQVEQQRARLLQLLGAMPPFACEIGEERFARIEVGYRQLLHHVTELSRTWKEVLPIDVHTVLIGQLLDTIVAALADRVMQLADIAAETSHQLHYLNSIIITNAAELLGSKALAAKYTKRWRKFVALTEILDDSLAGISEKHQAGVFDELFTKAELKGLLCALFDDNKKRTAVLTLIQG